MPHISNAQSFNDSNLLKEIGEQITNKLRGALTPEQIEGLEVTYDLSVLEEVGEGLSDKVSQVVVQLTTEHQVLVEKYCKLHSAYGDLNEKCFAVQGELLLSENHSKEISLRYKVS